MQSLWLENNQLSFTEKPLAERSGEAVIKVHKAGICGTDLELVKALLERTPTEVPDELSLGRKLA